MSIKYSGQQKGQQAPFRIVNGRFNILTLFESDQDASGTSSFKGPMIGPGLAGGVTYPAWPGSTLGSCCHRDPVLDKQKKMGCNGTNNNFQFDFFYYVIETDIIITDQ